MVAIAAVLCVAAWLAMAQVAHCLMSQAERGALNVLYGATDGLNWLVNTGWITHDDINNDPCLHSWYGVTCETVAGSLQMRSLNLHSNHLRGSIPTYACPPQPQVPLPRLLPFATSPYHRKTSKLSRRHD